MINTPTQNKEKGGNSSTFGEKKFKQGQKVGHKNVSQGKININMTFCDLQ